MSKEEFEHAGTKRFLVRLFFALTAILVIVFFTLSQSFAWRQVSDLRSEVNDLRAQAKARNSKADCLALYRNDVTTAIGLAVAANNELFIALSTRPLAQTDEERAANAANNVELGNELKASTGPLIAASKALAEYDRADPPPNECPHPNASTTGDD